MSVARDVKDAMAVMKGTFPEGLDYETAYDTTEFVEVSINEVLVTLYQALALVVIVVFIFMQDWRATIIPCVAIPVSLVGTLAFMLLFGMSINTISLFGLILAIGVVVDDAIVVVENVQRHMSEGLNSFDASMKAMEEVTGPVLATTLVLLAVFVPTAMMPGITGMMYSQFAITISISVLISSVNALTLSPALCAMLLRTPKPTRGPFYWFNTAFDWTTNRFAGLVGFMSRRAAIAAVAYLGVLGGTAWMASETPTGFIPFEDKGAFAIDISLPDAASLPRTIAIAEQVCDIVIDEPGVADVISVPGFSMLKGAMSSNASMVIVVLDDWDERPGREMHQFAIMGRLKNKFNAISEANIIPFPFPPISGLGTVGGIEYVLQDQLGRSPEELAGAMRGFVHQLNENPMFSQAYSTYRSDVPRLWSMWIAIRSKTWACH